MSGAVTRFTANSSDTVPKLLNKKKTLGSYGRNIRSFAAQKNGPREGPCHPSSRERRRADQERVQPHQEDQVKDHTEDRSDDVVPRRPRRRSGDQPGLLAPFQRDAVIDGISEERGEQDDGGKVAIGDEMGERPGLDGDEEGMLELGLDLAGHVGRDQEDEGRQHEDDRYPARPRGWRPDLNERRPREAIDQERKARDGEQREEDFIAI